MVYDYYQEKSKKSWKRRIIPLALLIFIIAAVIISANIYMNILQMDEIGGFSGVYLTNLAVKALSFLAGFIIIFSVIAATNMFIRRNINTYYKKMGLPQRKIPNFIIAAVAALIGANFFKEAVYQKILYFLNPTVFNITDPVFSKDVGYYIFERPFYSALYGFASSLAVFLIIYTLAFYIILLMANDSGNPDFSSLKDKNILNHNLINIALLFFVKAASYGLAKQDILYGKVVDYTGASYINVNIWLKYYTAAPFLVIAAVIAGLVFIKKGKIKKAIISFAAFPAVWLIVAIIAAIVQTVFVKPNVLQYESSYLTSHISETRKAYGLDKIQTYNFPQMQQLTPELLARNTDTINNIRLVDIDSTLQSDMQLQSNTAFYLFNSGDIINYTVNGQEIPVFITAREIDKNHLPNNSYINTLYRYTHGYGVVMNPINKITPKGQVDFALSDLDNKSPDPVLKKVRPEIYYGELTQDHVIVQAKNMDEITYDGSKTTRYEGMGGIRLNFFNKLLFSLKYGDFQMLISGYSNGAKLLLNRSITDRAQMAFPFLTIDKDPYILPTSDGKLKWIIDAYTVSDRFPNAQYFGDINYIRNSAKIVIDAYDGKAECYIVDNTDPIIRTLKKIYPEAFSDSPMPDELMAHARYPEMLFNLQTEMLKRYHIMPDRYEDFFSQQDLWDVAKRSAGSNTSDTQEIESFYNMIKLPGNTSDKAELILMRPFTPYGEKKNNMVSWLAVRNTGDQYGQMILYNFPKSTNILGPYQVEVKINQIDKISEDMTLWGQNGSEVYKGNLLVIPVENSVLYIEPIYMRASGTSATPEVKEIVVGYQSGDEFMYGIGANLDIALADLFSTQLPKTPAGQTAQDGSNKDTSNNPGSNSTPGAITPGTAPGGTAAPNIDRQKVNDIINKYDQLKQQVDELGKLIDSLK